MDANFWHRKWAEKDIGFHAHCVNPLLVDYFKRLRLASRSRVFLPLCGKTLDIQWLLTQGYAVVGVELSELAVIELFEHLGVRPEVNAVGKLLHYKASAIDIFVGDIFDLTQRLLGAVDGVYDRAALVALPKTLREKYTAHLKSLTLLAPQLLICFEYDQAQLTGPPFAVSEMEVKLHYGDHYNIRRLYTKDLDGGLKGLSSVKEIVWLLQKR